MRRIEWVCFLVVLVVAPVLVMAFCMNAVFELRFWRAPDGLDMAYFLGRPRPLEPGQKYPLLVFLHGVKEEGYGNDNIFKWGRKFMLDAMEKQGSFVLLPQCPKGHMWAPESPLGATRAPMRKRPRRVLQAVFDLIERVEARYPVDPNRVYITGLSMGGDGTWEAIERRPDLFAAAVPICGLGDARQAKRMARVAVWVFQGAHDKALPAKAGRDMVRALRKAGGVAKLTEAKFPGHAVWDLAFDDPKFLEWLYAQHRKPPPAPKKPKARPRRK